MVCLHKRKKICTWTSKNALNMIFVCENRLERHDIASSNSQPAFLHSKSLDSMPPLLKCRGEIFHLARRSSRQDLLKKSPGENVKNEFLATSGSPFSCTLQANF